MKAKHILPLALAATALAANADVVAHYDFEVRSGQIVEKVSGLRYAVQGHFTPENVPGAVGNALRLDGYTSWVEAGLGNVIPAGSQKMTISLWTAVESYPIVQIDTDTPQQVAIASCLDETAKTGFGFFIGFNGKYSFKTFIGGWPVTINVDTPLPTYQWNNLVAVIDCAARSCKLYNNGIEVGSLRCNGTVSLTASKLVLGRGPELNYSGPFLLTSYNGLLDDLTIYNEALSVSTIQSWHPENPANLDIPESRFAQDILRPRFHGMPAAAWTNESHGLYYSGGRYHLFFQKNADGPYMARLHWGHISSENLYDWREEKIAIAPGLTYDIKGCWSGCVFQDPVITGSRPAIIYTAVDYGHASIAMAKPTGTDLVDWVKDAANPIIGGRPGGLSDDFRDPYFFRNGDNAYIIVGTSKDGVGAMTLHRYDPTSKTWSNTGDIFFKGNSVSQAGTFWEMSNVTPMADGRWLFTATPLGLPTGVRTLYWTGAIGNDGKFVPASDFNTPKTVELNSRDGFGLLSPTIYNHNGVTLAMGIVPDKLSSDNNWNLGWAHCFSLPREWSLDSRGSLIQKPYSGLTGLRTATSFTRAAFTLNGTVGMSPVSGREVEILGRFTVGSTPFGFRFFKNAHGAATATYNPNTGELVFDFSSLNRLVNDGGVYNGVYRLALPEFLRRGSELKLNIFIDHSIVDVFVNDKWASSIRVFPTDRDADGVEVWSDGDVPVLELGAWNLSPKGGSHGVTDVEIDSTPDADAPVTVYNVAGMAVRSGVPFASALEGLAPGIYLVNGRKYAVR